MAKRKQGLDMFAIEPAIADMDAFGLARASTGPARCGFRMRRIRGWSIFETLRPRERETPGGARLTSEQIRRRPAAFIPRVPHLEHGADAVEPRHRHGLPGVEHDDGVG